MFCFKHFSMIFACVTEHWSALIGEQYKVYSKTKYAPQFLASVDFFSS